jgi:hypothetical protein
VDEKLTSLVAYGEAEYFGPVHSAEYQQLFTISKVGVAVL